MENSLYTQQMSRFLKGLPWPSGLIWEIEEHELDLKFVLFRDNINALDGTAKLSMAGTLNHALTKIRDSGIPIYVKVTTGNGQRV